MKINVEIGNPNKLKNNIIIKAVATITCSYNADVVNYLKALPTRAYNTETKGWEIPLNQLAKFCDRFKEHEIEISGIYEELENDVLAEIPKDFKFKTNPFQHQIDGLRFALTKEKFLLCDDQGLGKSKQVIDWVVSLKEQGKIKRALIVCGVNSLKYNWQKEVETHSNEKAWVLGTRFRKNGNQYEGSAKDKLDDLNNLPDCTFIITNIETFRAGSKKVGKNYEFPIAEKLQKLCKKGELGLIAADEIHKCKNPTSLQGRAFLKVRDNYMVAMTGTPLMNSPLDLFVPLNWLGLDTHTFYKFKNHFCTLGGFGGAEVVGYKNLEEIREILDSYMLRRLKMEVLDLPEKMIQEEYVEMSSKQAKIYADVLDGVRKDLHKMSFSDNPLAMLIKLRQATGYTGILSDTIQESAKLDRMEEMVEELASSNQKCIIFSNWEQITKEAKSRLAKYKPAYITGATNASERMKEVERFQNDKDCKVIIGTIGAMGTGLTLTAAQTVIFLDEPWTRASKDQAEDRAHRIGTQGTVNIITLLTKSTIDEKINEIVYKKGMMSDMLIDGKGGKIDMRMINELIS